MRIYYLGLTNFVVLVMITWVIKVLNFFKYYSIEISPYVYFVSGVILFLMISIIGVNSYLSRSQKKQNPVFNIEVSFIVLLSVSLLCFMCVFFILITLMVWKNQFLYTNIMEIRGIKVTKVFFEEKELLEFCKTELLRMNKSALNINLEEIVRESNNSLEECETYLKQKIDEEEKKSVFQARMILKSIVFFLASLEDISFRVLTSMVDTLFLSWI